MHDYSRLLRGGSVGDVNGAFSPSDVVGWPVNEADSVRNKDVISVHRTLTGSQLQDITSRMLNRGPLPKAPRVSKESLFSYHTAHDMSPTCRSDGSYNPSASNLPLHPNLHPPDLLSISASGSNVEKPPSAPTTIESSPEIDVTGQHLRSIDDTERSPMESMLAALDAFNSPPQDLSLLSLQAPGALCPDVRSRLFYENPAAETPEPPIEQPIIGSPFSCCPTPNTAMLTPNGWPRRNDRDDRDDQSEKNEFGCWARLLLVFGLKERKRKAKV